MTPSEQIAADKARLKDLRKRHTVGSLARDSQFEMSGHIGFLLGIIERFAKERQRLRAALSEKNDREKNYAANAAMLLDDPKFRDYLASRQRVSRPDNKADMDLALKAALQIESKKQLNTEPQATERWLAFRRGFENWKRYGE